MKRGVAAISLDISSRSTGVAIFPTTDISSTPFSIELITINDKFCMGERLHIFEKNIRSLLREKKPSAVVIEEIYRGPNIKTFKTLSQFHGIAVKEIWNVCKYSPTYISVNECRSLLTKRFKCKSSLRTKEDIFEVLNDSYKLELSFNKDNDKTDALALGLAYFEKCMSQATEVKIKKKRS